MKTRTIVLIHGMFMTTLCWEKWIPCYEAKGYRVIAPAWPGRKQPVEALRKNHPDSALAKLNLGDVVDHMMRVFKSLDEKPVIIGHSMGGLVVQLLLQRDLALAGVARPAFAGLETLRYVDYTAVWRAKSKLLEKAFAEFTGDPDFYDFVAAGVDELRRHGGFEARQSK